MKKINIQIIYRNYKPLHKIYYNLISIPPAGVEYTVPKVKTYPKALFRFYRKHGDSKVFQLFIRYMRSILFSTNYKASESEPDLLEFIQFYSREIPNKPYIVDIEHIVGLADFVYADEAKREEIYNFLAHENCKQIVCFSNAAKSTIKNMFPDSGIELEKKAVVVYPAQPKFKDLYGNQSDDEYLKSDKKFKILFVGNDPLRKGLHEVIAAFHELQKKYSDIELYVVSNLPADFTNYADMTDVHLYPSNFSMEEIVQKFFMRADVFVLPTHADTFGMVFLDALASGLPVIATKQFAVPEIVEDGVTGLLVDSDRLYLNSEKVPDKSTDKKQFSNTDPEEKVVKQLVSKIDQLYNDAALLQRFSENAVKLFEEDGKFSIQTRNDKLIEIYKRALS